MVVVDEEREGVDGRSRPLPRSLLLLLLLLLLFSPGERIRLVSSCSGGSMAVCLSTSTYIQLCLL